MTQAGNNLLRGSLVKKKFMFSNIVMSVLDTLGKSSEGLFHSYNNLQSNGSLKPILCE